MVNVSFYVGFYVNTYSRKRKCLDELFASSLRWLRPPFRHTCVAFKPSDLNLFDDGKSLLEYEVSVNGLQRLLDTFDSSLWGFVKITVDETVARRLISLLDRMFKAKKANKRLHSLSYWKSTNLPQVGRWVCCLSSLPRPTEKTLSWTCSEIICFALQEVGIIPWDIHPSYVDTTELYLILRGLKCCDSKAICPIIRDKVPDASGTSADSMFLRFSKPGVSLLEYDSLNALSSRVVR